MFVERRCHGYSPRLRWRRRLRVGVEEWGRWVRTWTRRPAPSLGPRTATESPVYTQKRYVFIQRSIQSVGSLKALHFIHWQISSFRHQLDFSQQLGAKTIHISTTVYSQIFICTAEWTGASRRERKFPSFETVSKGFRSQALSIANPAF